MSQPALVKDVLLEKLNKDLERAMVKVTRIKEHIAIIEKALNRG